MHVDLALDEKGTVTTTYLYHHQHHHDNPHLKILSASKKFLKRLATSKSCRNSFWKSFEGRVFHAMASMIAVKIQCSSPRGVLRCCSSPGMLSTQSGSTPSMDNCQQKQHVQILNTGKLRAKFHRETAHDPLPPPQKTRESLCLRYNLDSKINS